MNRMTLQNKLSMDLKMDEQDRKMEQYTDLAKEMNAKDRKKKVCVCVQIFKSNDIIITQRSKS